MATDSHPVSVYEAVAEYLALQQAPPQVADLWAEISREFQDAGPEAVKALLETKVRALDRAAKKDLKMTRDVAAAVGSTRRRPSPRRPASPGSRRPAR